MEVIDGLKVFSNPSTFFKWLWNYDKDTVIDEEGNLWCGRNLIAKLRFYKRK